MSHLIKLPLALVLQKLSPSSFPYSLMAMGIYLLVYMFSGMVGLIIDPLTIYSPMEILRLIVIEAVLLTLYCYLVLSLNKRANRLIKTAGSVFASNIIFNCLYILLTVVGGMFLSEDSFILSIFYLSLFVWSIHISGWIISESIDSVYASGVFIFLGYTAIWMIVSGLI